MNNERVLVFIPAYNCQDQVIHVLNDLVDTCYEKVDKILLVDNRSTDDTAKRALEFKANRNLGKMVVAKNDENYGLGGSHKVALNYGLEHNFDFLVILHGDNQAESGEVALLLDEAAKDTSLDAVLGSRFMRGSRLMGYSALRTYGNIAINIIYSIVLFKWITDLGSGLNLLRLRSVRDLGYEEFSNHMNFNHYLLFKMIDLGWKFSFSPITWNEEDQVSNINPFKFGAEAVLSAFKWKFSKNSMLEKNKKDYSYKILTGEELV